MLDTNFKKFDDTCTNQVFKDYTSKISMKLYESKNVREESENINSLIILLNWCFREKNDFFVENFNKKLIHPISDSYNKIKTNIFSQEILIGIESIFNTIDKQNIKTLKFILFQYIKVYDSLLESSATNNEDKNNLCQKVPKQAMENCIIYMTKYMEN